VSCRHHGDPIERNDVNRRDDQPRDADAWKEKMGPEFSGLERTRDFLVALLFVAALVIVASVIAYLAFG
jgi:hypothetical protein